MRRDRQDAFAFANPEWLDTIDSTNDELKRRLALSPLERGTVLAARQQTRGRGRMGNAWHSTPNRDLAFSFLWEGDSPGESAGTLPMACALGVIDFLASPGLEIASLCRWPNDVMTARGKMAGILTESIPAETSLLLVIGVGLNVSRDNRRDLLAGVATASIEDFSAERPGQEELLKRLLPFLAARITAWERKGYPAMAGDFGALLWGKGTEARIRTGSGSLSGRITGLGPGGELLLATNGGMVAITSASGIDWRISRSAGTGAWE
ncbi:MAG: biotin--[acetyl-CoA-carboxylase] ligase [Planctomycetota bacterium]|nr:biotin--[acetyl-CoA-carboxylase] ligase [Planctomycetota bacterium]